MRAVIQRSTEEGRVIVNGDIVGAITKGLIVFLGVEHEDNMEDVEWLSRKIAGMRLFSDENGKMNLSVKDVNGGILLISQFTLHASTKKGNRPSFIRSADPQKAEALYDEMADVLRKQHGISTEKGVFGAHMMVDFINDGPVTIIIDSKNKE